MINDWIFKVIVAGAGGVGKTALVDRYVTGKFSENHKMTIGAQFCKKEVDIEKDTLVRFLLWDFAGEERFRFILPEYCKGSQGALICYDVTDYTTFEAIAEWLHIIRKNAGEIPIFLIGLKADLDCHEVTPDVAAKYAEDTKCLGSVICSAKTSVNVNEMFEAFAKWLIYFATQ